MKSDAHGTLSCGLYNRVVAADSWVSWVDGDCLCWWWGQCARVVLKERIAGLLRLGLNFHPSKKKKKKNVYIYEARSMGCSPAWVLLFLESCLPK